MSLSRSYLILTDLGARRMVTAGRNHNVQYAFVLAMVCSVSWHLVVFVFFFFSSRRRHTRFDCDWSSDVCSSDLSTGDGFVIDAPSFALANIRLDLGSFIGTFAAPILDQIKKLLDPLAWLVGPDGFLNKRIPLLSDLAGHTITGKDLVILFDPNDGPKIIKFLDFVQELYFLANLVDSAKGTNAGINFGDLILAGKASDFGPNF